MKTCLSLKFTGSVRVTWLAQEHNTMILARTQTRTAQSRVHYPIKKANMPPCISMCTCTWKSSFLTSLLQRCYFASDMWSFCYVLWYMYTGMPAPRCQTDEPTCVMCLQEEVMDILLNLMIIMCNILHPPSS